MLVACIVVLLGAAFIAVALECGEAALLLIGAATGLAFLL
jgi:hypothetical protein